VIGHFDKGVQDVRLSSWKYFSDYVNQKLLDYTTFCYRGHGNSTWKLEPTIDRIVKAPASQRRALHLNRFKLETRGRRGNNPPAMTSDDDWWALGQHHGLATPLLDWTESPFVALYFAAVASGSVNSTNIAVFAISRLGIERRNKAIRADEAVEEINSHKPTVKIVRPLSDENNRLVSQRGLFTRGPNNVDLEAWTKTFFDPTESYMDLIKVTIPASGVQDCLRYLNRMNINHSTLFPDLTGASDYCNRHLSVQKY
jgi:hypothetical protein